MPSCKKAHSILPACSNLSDRLSPRSGEPEASCKYVAAKSRSVMIENIGFLGFFYLRGTSCSVRHLLCFLTCPCSCSQCIPAISQGHFNTQPPWRECEPTAGKAGCPGRGLLPLLYTVPLVLLSSTQSALPLHCELLDCMYTIWSLHLPSRGGGLCRNQLI